MNGDGPVKPYKGLVPYSEEDAPFFFGRETEVQTIVSNLMASRLTLLYGASGVGKSSVLRAGVAYHIRKMARDNLDETGVPEFAIAVFNSWRDDPMTGLTDCVHEAVAQALGSRRVDLAAASGPLVERLEHWAEALGGELLIILDQFEEYFLYHAHEDGEGSFGFEFPRIVNRSDLGVNFLISIRDDSLSRLDHFQGRIPFLFDNRLPIRHLDREAARRAIVKPLEQFNRLYAAGRRTVEIEPELVEAVLDQVKAGQVVLGEAATGRFDAGSRSAADGGSVETPFLQMVMTRLWEEEERAGSRMIRLDTLNRLGGSETIVRTHLDQIMGALTRAEKDVAAGIFNQLVTPSGTKIAHLGSDLAAYAGLPVTDVTQLLERLSKGDVRILRPVKSLEGLEEPRYEIFHDVLAPAILDWRRRYIIRQERAQVKTQLRRRLLRFGVAGLFVLFLVFGLYVFHSNRTIKSQVEAAQAVSLLQTDPEAALLRAIGANEHLPPFTTESDRFPAELALKQALVESHVRAVMPEHKGGVTCVAFSPDGQFLVTAGKDTKARVCNARTGDEVAELPGHKEVVTTAAFSPRGDYIMTVGDDEKALISNWTDGGLHGGPQTLTHVKLAAFAPSGSNHLMTGNSDYTVTLWETGTHRDPWTKKWTERKHTNDINSAAFSRDGKLLVTTASNDPPIVWDVQNGRKIAQLLVDNKSEVNRAEFSPDNQYIVTAHGDATARIWETRTGRLLHTLQGHRESVARAMFNPKDPLAVVTTSEDKTVRLWDVKAGTQKVALYDHSGPVRSVDFSKDGKYVVTASFVGTVLISDASDLRVVTELLGHTNSVNAAIFSPDEHGSFVATASEDGTARVWEAPASGSFALEDHSGVIDVRSFSPDGKLAVTATEIRENDESTYAARVWELETGRVTASLQGHAARLNGTAFSPDGRFVATASDDKTARIWDLETGTEAKVLPHPEVVTGVVFGPQDGRFVLTSSDDSTARVWEWGKAEVCCELDCQPVVKRAIFSPDGRFIVVISADGAARVWEWRKPEGQGNPVELPRVKKDATERRFETAAFSPDSRFIISTAYDDPRALVWDWTSADGLTKPVTLQPPDSEDTHNDAVTSAVFSPDGKVIVTTSRDRTARVWLWPASRRRIDPIELRGHTRQVSVACFSPNGTCLITGSNDGTVRLWETSGWQCLKVLRDYDAYVEGAAFSPDGRFILTSSKDDRTVRSYTCEVCDVIDNLLKLAQSHVRRERR